MRIRPPWIAVTLAVLLSGLVVLLASSGSERMTKEELAQAAGSATAEASYEYYFSEEELARLNNVVTPYNCSSSASLGDYDQYLCGVADYFVRDEGNFVPAGYMFASSLARHQGGPVIGIRIVRTASP